MNLQALKAEQVRAEALGDESTIPQRLSNACSVAVASAVVEPTGLERVADVPIYTTDALVRRAPSLQQTADARPPHVGVNAALWAELGLQAGDRVRVLQGGASAVLPVRVEPTLAPGCARVPAGHADTASLGAMSGTLTLERVPAAVPSEVAVGVPA